MFRVRLWFARVLQAVLYRGVPPLKPSDDRLFVSAGEKDKGYDGFFLPVSLYESCSSDWMSNMMTSYITLVVGGAHISNDGIDSLFFMVFRRQHHDVQVFRKPEKNELLRKRKDVLKLLQRQSLNLMDCTDSV